MFDQRIQRGPPLWAFSLLAMSQPDSAPGNLFAASLIICNIADHLHRPPMLR
ncbi:MAG TPA: hypothetical protein VIJ23_20860 [Mycobacterium sp.]